MLVELGVCGVAERSRWFQEFFQAARTTHTQLGAFIYFQLFPGRFYEIQPEDACADDWREEMAGSHRHWWHSAVMTDDPN